MKSVLLAIDPGASGGIAILGGGSVGAEAYAMPATPKDVCDLITVAKVSAEMNELPIKCYMEEVGGFAGVGQPGSAMFNFGRGFGNLEGFLIAHGIVFELVRPQRWQKGVGLNFPPVHKGAYDPTMSHSEKVAEKKRVTNLNSARKRDNKNRMKEMAQRLYPEIKVTLATADALLILHYATNL